MLLHSPGLKAFSSHMLAQRRQAVPAACSCSEVKTGPQLLGSPAPGSIS